MTSSGDKQNLGGYFKVEVSIKDKRTFEDKYLEIRHEQGKLNILDYDRDYSDKHSRLWRDLKLNFISQAREISKPKCANCFCITHAGEEIVVQAENGEVMRQWIQELNGASRITVPESDLSNLKPTNCRNEVAGGVIVHIPVSPTGDSGDESMPALSLPSIHSGYAVKQGGVRKNWKKRYFLLNQNGLQYYKDDQEREPIKVIPVVDMKRARKVAGEHHPHREFLFEIITEHRTYNIQCDSAVDCDSWVTEINKLIENQPLPYPEKTSLPKKMESKLLVENDKRKYTPPTAPKFLPQEKLIVEKQKHIAQKQQHQQTKRASNEEETVTSTAVWDDPSKPSEVDRKSKTGIKLFSPKNWTLW